jgi:hypothetical protein
MKMLRGKLAKNPKCRLTSIVCEPKQVMVGSLEDLGSLMLMLVG